MLPRPIASPHNCCHCNSWLGNWWKLADGLFYPPYFFWVYWTNCRAKWASVGITFIKLKMCLNILLPVLKKRRSGKIMRAPRATWQSCANVFDLFPLLLLLVLPPLRDDDDLYNLVAPRRMLHNNKEAKSKLLTGTASSDLRNNKTKSSSTALHDPTAQCCPYFLSAARPGIAYFTAGRRCETKKRRLNIFLLPSVPFFFCCSCWNVDIVDMIVCKFAPLWWGKFTY